MSEPYDIKHFYNICVKVYLKSEMGGTLEEKLNYILSESYLVSWPIDYFSFRAFEGSWDMSRMLICKFGERCKFTDIPIL